MSMHAPGSVAPTDLILQRIASELAGCRAILADIEAAANAMAASLGPVDDADASVATMHVRELQKIDLLGQVLDDLGTCLGALAALDEVAQIGPLNLRCLTRNLRLDDVRRRLQGLQTAAGQSGGPEFF